MIATTVEPPAVAQRLQRSVAASTNPPGPLEVTMLLKIRKPTRDTFPHQKSLVATENVHLLDRWNMST